ncbi:hypothetical protein SAMN02745824_1366 [Parasphingorhabdus marina DSM 22363]|uniref:Uncharacterized protein n=1 Tax=Parasphingorhabdus marina DSM 22363 TaxID=1123272 RepID=A0A1N6D0K7_9SPHN|nr:hypothetical protein [Parasphingorhabdus marina]SIN64253.1 hypothetical protein SAMN02745824_1366 [Parasphingorhabdus marina DSM 22363]
MPVFTGKPTMGWISGMASLFAAIPVSAQSLPTTENGFYMIRTNADDLSRYRAVDSMCIGENHDDLMAFINTGNGTLDFLELREGEKVAATRLKLSEPDAGVSQIRYSLVEPDSEEAVFELHFINPGALGDPAKIPMATLSSVHIPRVNVTHLDCLMGEQILYAGIDQNHRVTVMMDEEGTLVFRQSSVKQAWVARNISGGFWSTGKRGEIIFTFFEGSTVTSIKAAPHQRIEYPAWRTTSSVGREYSASPKGFFVADMEKLGSRSNRLPFGLVLHFERLEICRHLAGEASGNPDRDKQVAESRDKAGCDEASAQHAGYIEQFAGNEAVSKILKTHGTDF